MNYLFIFGQTKAGVLKLYRARDPPAEIFHSRDTNVIIGSYLFVLLDAFELFYASNIQC